MGGVLRGGDDFRLVYVLEESYGKQYLSDFSQFGFGLARKQMLSESAFSIYDLFLKYRGESS